MEDVTRKKINLLVHLAKADGEFHSTERKFLEDLLKANGIKNYNFPESATSSLDDVNAIIDREELLYWALQLIQVDSHIHPDEVAYCKTLAIKLKFRPDIVDQYKEKALPSFQDFLIEADAYKLALSKA